MMRYICKTCKEDFLAHPNAEDCPYCGSTDIKPVFNGTVLEDE